MSIVISPKVRLIVSQADTTDLDFALNKATEISILKDITINRTTLSRSASRSTVSSTSNRVPTHVNEGYSPVTLQFSTYMKPVTQGNNKVQASEKLLWESLSGATTTNTITESTILFTSGNINKLFELYFYLVFDDGSYYKVNRGVVNTANIEIDISNIAKVTWSITALSMSYVKTPDLTFNQRLNTGDSYIRNKLSTLSLGGVPLAITKANVVISNTVQIISRQRVGELTVPTGHYVTDRSVSCNLGFYLNTDALSTADLMNNLESYTDLSGINTLTNIGISIGGTSTPKVEINMPTSKIRLNSGSVGVKNTVELIIVPQESVTGAGDEINLVYYN